MTNRNEMGAETRRAFLGLIGTVGVGGLVGKASGQSQREPPGHPTLPDFVHTNGWEVTEKESVLEDYAYSRRTAIPVEQNSAYVDRVDGELVPLLVFVAVRTKDTPGGLLEEYLGDGTTEGVKQQLLNGLNMYQVIDYFYNRWGDGAFNYSGPMVNPTQQNRDMKRPLAGWFQSFNYDLMAVWGALGTGSDKLGIAAAYANELGDGIESSVLRDKSLQFINRVHP